jgi:hypothetical protein
LSEQKDLVCHQNKSCPIMAKVRTKFNMFSETAYSVSATRRS